MIDRPVFNKIEVYITNVCNLTCDQCKFCPTKKDFRSIFPIRKGTAKL